MSQLYSDPYITNVLLKKAEERFPFDTGKSVRPSKHLECVCCLLQIQKWEEGGKKGNTTGGVKLLLLRGRNM